MNLSQIIKELNNKEDILVLNPEEKETLLVYIKQMEQVIDQELKWI